MSSRLTRSSAEQWTQKAKTRNRVQWSLLGLVCVVSIGLFILAAQTPAPDGPINDDPDVQADFRGVARVQTSTGSGSGFLVSERYLLSAAHVTGGNGSSVQLSFKDGSQVSGTVVASGYDELQRYMNGDGTARDGATPHDWALVELSSPKPFDWTIYVDRGLASSVSEQSEVLAVGYPGGGDHNVSSGILSGRDAQELRTDANIDPGHSGGLLYAKDEQAALGIIVSTLSIDGQRATSVHNVVPIGLVLQKIQDEGIALPV